MKQFNYILFILSLICIIAWLLISNEILKSRTVRLKGSLISVQIIDLRHAKTHRKATVEVQGERMDAGGIRDSYKKGDTIQVYYLEGVNTVVQGHINPRRYYWYLGFTSILLIVGVALFIESLKGENIWSYISSD